MSVKHGLALPAALAALMLLPTCAPKATEMSPPVATPEAFSSAGEAPLPEPWWTALGEAQLNELVEGALEGNFTLRQAWARLDQAHAVAARAGAPLWPSLDGSAGAARRVVKTTPGGRAYTTQYALGLAASYEVDLWGRVRSAADAARLDAAASAEDVRAAAITLSAQIASAWCQLIEQRGQRLLLGEQIATNEKYLEVITLKFRRGQVSAADVLQQRQLVKSNHGERVLVDASIKVLEHQLAVLTGRSPTGASFDCPAKLPTLRPAPQTGLPAEWIRRRPDMRAAELRIRAADQRVAAAIAERFPRLSLSVGGETTSARVRDLFDNWMANLAANVVAPLFDAGARRAEVQRTRAVVSERLGAYGQTVLTALQEVEDALWQEARQAEYVASLDEQLALAKQAADQTLDNYTKGAGDFTRYLTTLLSYQRLQRTALQARRQRVQFRIDLYRALAGSWPMERPGPLTTTPAAPETPAEPDRDNDDEADHGDREAVES